MVEPKAVDAAYPLLGRIELAAAEQLHALLADRDGAGAVAIRPDREAGSAAATIRLGDARFELRGTIEREPDRIASVAAFGRA